jgi:hypothetical protein
VVVTPAKDLDNNFPKTQLDVGPLLSCVRASSQGNKKDLTRGCNYRKNCSQATTIKLITVVINALQ